MEAAQIFSIVLTGIIAATTIAYAVVTTFLLLTTKKSVDLTRRALMLSALMQEADLVFRETEQHPDGSQRFGGSQSVSRQALRDYGGKVIKFREEMEKLK